MADLVAAVQQLLRKPEANNHSISGQPTKDKNSPTYTVTFPPCSFCKKQGHTREDCWERKNTPYCTECATYGHEQRSACIRNVNRGFVQPRYRDQSGGRRYVNNRGRFNEDTYARRDGANVQRFPRRDEPRRVNNMECFNCGEKGHIKAECRQSRSRQGNGRGPGRNQNRN